MTKGSKGNGLALTNELLQAMLGELGHIKGKLGELDAIKTELGHIKGKLGELDAIRTELGAIKGRLGELDAIKSELSEIKTEVVQHGQILREHGQILREHSVRLTNIEGSMRQVASFVGQDRLEQNQKIQGLTQRVEVLERKVA